MIFTNRLRAVKGLAGFVVQVMTPDPSEKVSMPGGAECTISGEKSIKATKLKPHRIALPLFLLCIFSSPSVKQTLRIASDMFVNIFEKKVVTRTIRIRSVRDRIQKESS